MKQLINEGYSQQTIEGALAARILEAASMLHIGGNLSSGEPVKIAAMLVSEYPTSSLEDFTIMLQRGIIGRYGKVFGFDISIVFGWMGMYMEEWAEEKERQLSKEKGEQLKQLIDDLDTPYTTDVDKLLNDLKESLRDSNVKSVPNLTKEEIKKEGQSDPPKRKGIAPVRPEWIVGDLCDQCGGTGMAGPSPEEEFTCSHCKGTGEINRVIVHASSLEEARKAYNATFKK